LPFGVETTRFTVLKALKLFFVTRSTQLDSNLLKESEHLRLSNLKARLDLTQGTDSPQEVKIEQKTPYKKGPPLPQNQQLLYTFWKRR
jgi:hypothetical protein